MFGTRSVREPSVFATSTARPRFTCSWRTTTGVPSSTPNPDPIAGTFATARTAANAMRWVKLTFPRPVRDRWLFRIWRLTSSSFAGTLRTDVAVGTPRLASMFSTIRAAAPRIGFVVSPSSTSGAVPLPAGGGVGGGAGGGGGGGGGRRRGRRGRSDRDRPVAGARGGAARGHVVGEELLPGRCHRRRIRQVLAVHLVDESGVGAQILERVGHVPEGTAPDRDPNPSAS